MTLTHETVALSGHWNSFCLAWCTYVRLHIWEYRLL